uniref:Kinesin motor domain-containing protein n=1 Tax=Gouania willdenowi TaxID=441366 RepID=A0A8C5I129_GOUWI
TLKHDESCQKVGARISAALNILTGLNLCYSRMIFTYSVIFLLIQIFEDIGHDVLKAAFEGFNVCIFAYGQSGSGKSYTMMGHKVRLSYQGLIPRVCEGLFLETSRGKTDAAIVHTEVSYLEIYNEHVLDLLKTRSPFTVGGRLRVREHPKDGPYVESQRRIAVNNYNELKDLIAVGDNNRTTASTDMNDVSSRSHAIFTIMLTQVKDITHVIAKKGDVIRFVL